MTPLAYLINSASHLLNVFHSFHPGQRRFLCDAMWKSLFQICTENLAMECATACDREQSAASFSDCRAIFSFYKKQHDRCDDEQRLHQSRVDRVRRALLESARGVSELSHLDDSISAERLAVDMYLTSENYLDYLRLQRQHFLVQLGLKFTLTAR